MVFKVGHCINLNGERQCQAPLALAPAGSTRATCNTHSRNLVEVKLLVGALSLAPRSPTRGRGSVSQAIVCSRRSQLGSIRLPSSVARGHRRRRGRAGSGSWALRGGSAGCRRSRGRSGRRGGTCAEVEGDSDRAFARGGASCRTAGAHRSGSSGGGSSGGSSEPPAWDPSDGSASGSCAPPAGSASERASSGPRPAERHA